MTRWLCLLIHAHKCPERDRSATAAEGPHLEKCMVPQCAIVIRVLEHMTTCSEGRTCLCEGEGVFQNEEMAFVCATLWIFHF